MTGVTEECALGAVQLSLQLLSSFSVVDIYVGSIPFDDLARFIPQRVGTEQEPSIFSIETADACFDLARLAGRENRSPVLDESVQVIRVNGVGPPPVQYVLDRDPGKVEPALVEEISFTIRIGCPRQRRDRVHDRPKLILHSFAGQICDRARHGSPDLGSDRTKEHQIGVVEGPARAYASHQYRLWKIAAGWSDGEYQSTFGRIIPRTSRKRSKALRQIVNAQRLVPASCSSEGPRCVALRVCELNDPRTRIRPNVHAYAAHESSLFSVLLDYVEQREWQVIAVLAEHTGGNSAGFLRFLHVP